MKAKFIEEMDAETIFVEIEWSFSGIASKTKTSTSRFTACVKKYVRSSKRPVHRCFAWNAVEKSLRLRRMLRNGSFSVPASASHRGTLPTLTREEDP
jgi:hypothetical protein